MRLLAGLFLTGFIVVFQAVTESACRIGDAAPHLVALFASYAALRASRSRALAVAAAAGLLLDLSSLDPWGANLVSLVLLAHVVSRAAAAGWTERWLPCALILSVALPMTFACRAGLVWVLQGAPPLWEQEAWTVLYTLALAWPTYSVLERARPLFVPRPRSAVF